MKRIFQNLRFKWLLFILAFLSIGYFLLQINLLINQLRIDEKKNIEIWASAISRKANLVEQTDKFFLQVKEEERKRVEQFIEAHTLILSQPLDKELVFYYKFISENKTIPLIITDEFNNIQLSQNVDLPNDYKVLVGDLYKNFTRNPPLVYEVYGMTFKLYYTESKVYTDLHNMLIDLTTSLITEITENSVKVPVIISDSSKTKLYAAGNILKSDIEGKNLKKVLERMASSNTPISITLPNNTHALIFYEKSYILKALQYYPIFFILILLVIIYIAYHFFSTIKSSEQNYVWAGMSKETAHQLGTPISSLIAWVEYLRLNPENEPMCVEITKDINRLEMITQRFSKIGSIPELEKQDLIPIINSSIEYLKIRSSKKVKFEIEIPQDKAIIIPLNKHLLEWAIENITKNAIDAMEGVGVFKVKVSESNKRIHIDISDTGKGIPKNCHKKIFKAGYSTKQRGWGLGLSLTKRIIEDYHKGKIFVKQSTLSKGTTFRICLRKLD
ncbi:MAG: HAMP domain-containing sensor histidine kinase [Bacteroidales bacterium]|nr:HAMP domain-containing sensor histidine kinase [Bacteroidales bacterium]